MGLVYVAEFVGVVLNLQTTWESSVDGEIESRIWYDVVQGLRGLDFLIFVLGFSGEVHVVDVVYLFDFGYVTGQLTAHIYKKTFRINVFCLK